MSKKFIQIQCYRRKYKLETKDIKSVHHINTKKLPLPPKFESFQNHARK